MIRILPLFAMIVFLAVRPTAAAPGPLAVCEKAKLDAVGKAAKQMLRCHATAAARGAAVDPACLQRTRVRIGEQFGTTEATRTCPFVGEAAVVTGLVDDFVGQLSSALAPPGPSTCAQRKITGSGARMLGILKAEGKHALTPEKEALGLALTKVQQRFAGAWGRAEALLDCATFGDAATVAGEVDLAGAALVDSVRGVLKNLAAGRLIGTAIRFDALNGSDYQFTAARHFNHVSTWGETVWANVEPSRGVFNLAPLERVVDFAEQYGMAVKGITLVWHEYLPAWMSNITDPVDFRNAMEHHITTLVGGYAGRIHVWDVVNEAITGSALRVTPFLQRLGPAYIADAFRMANAADPSALLFYNDFTIQDVNPSSDLLYQLVQDLLADGVPIHGIGFQMHVGVTNSWDPARFDSMRQNLQRFADLGLLVQIAEAEVSLGNGGTRKDELVAQRRTYHDMVRLCLAVTGCSVNFFGFTDEYHWIPFFLFRNDDPLMFDAQYLPKPAFFGVRDALVGY